VNAAPGLVASRYRLAESLGVGGMGRVWRARDENLGRDVAIKRVDLPAELIEQERDVATERTLREARAAARLNHPNVVRVYDVLKADDHPWIVMEYVASRSLQTVIEADGPLDPKRVAQIGVEVIIALRAAQKAGVQHRDIKPSNVLLAEDGRVVLTDFGLATIEGDGYVTRTGLVLGSPEYIAPERARAGTGGMPADIWSLGATLYMAVEGRSPYQRRSSIETLSALATEDPDPMVLAGPLAPALRRLLRKNPADRPTLDKAEALLREVVTGVESPRLLKRFGLPRQRAAAPAAPPTPVAPVSPAPTAAAAPTPAVALEKAPETAPEKAPAQPPAPPKARKAPPPPTVPGPGRPFVERPAAGEPARPPIDLRDTARGVGARLARLPFRATMIASAAVIVVVVALIVWLASDSGGGRPVARRLAGVVAQPTPTGGANARPSSEPSSPAVGSQQGSAAPPPSSGAGQNSGQTGTSGGTLPAIPADWMDYHDPTGFSVYVPRGWTPSKEGSIMYFRDHHSGRVLGIDQTSTPQPDPVQDWRTKEHDRVNGGDFPGYTEIKIVPVSYFTKAADWEFTFNGDSARQHVNNRGVITNPHQAYGIYWQTTDADWAAARPDLQLVFDSFRPKPAG
jgi:eukaryotic-like serine/threonine-protein kinase